MKSKTRYNVRLSQRRGVSVRLGDEADVPVIHRLLVQTGQRNGFEADSEALLRHWFEVLRPHHLQLFLAEHEDEPVSALLAVTFGDTVVYKRGAWSGRHGALRPNEALHWAAMMWGRYAGFHRYDFDGIEPAVARRVLRGEPDGAGESVTRFKLGFGGDVVMLPESLLHLGGAVPRRAYEVMGARLASLKRVKRVKRVLRRLKS